MDVGVVIPVHGFSPYLVEAIDTVLAERPAAVVVVDDASPRPVVLDAEQAASVTLVRREGRGGPGGARRTGERHLPPSVDVVAFCDADDAWLPGSLRRRLDVLEDWAFGAPLIVGPDGRPTGEAWPQPGPGRHEAEQLGRMLYEHDVVCTSSVLVGRDAYRRAGGFRADRRVGEDWDLWLRLCGAGAAAGVAAGEVVRYRRHAGGLTGDVTAVARAALRIHAEHPGFGRPSATRGRDHAALAGGLVRDREHRAALRSWLAAVRGGAPSPRPLLRGLRRRDPYVR